MTVTGEVVETSLPTALTQTPVHRKQAARRREPHPGQSAATASTTCSAYSLERLPRGIIQREPTDEPMPQRYALCMIGDPCSDYVFGFPELKKHGEDKRKAFKSKSGNAQNDVVKLRSGAVQREANPTEQRLSLNVDEGLSGRTASTTCYAPIGRSHLFHGT